MKKMIILVGLMSSLLAKAETFQRTPVLGVIALDNMYAAYEVLTPKYEKIILDCQSFIHGMNFYNDSKIVREIKMVDYGNCENVYDFISQSKEENKSVCMEVAEESNTITLSNDEASDCQ